MGEERVSHASCASYTRTAMADTMFGGRSLPLLPAHADHMLTTCCPHYLSTACLPMLHKDFAKSQVENIRYNTTVTLIKRADPNAQSDMHV